MWEKNHPRKVAVACALFFKREGADGVGWTLRCMWEESYGQVGGGGSDGARSLRMETKVLAGPMLGGSLFMFAAPAKAGESEGGGLRAPASR